MVHRLGIDAVLLIAHLAQRRRKIMDSIRGDEDVHIAEVDQLSRRHRHTALEHHRLPPPIRGELGHALDLSSGREDPAKLAQRVVPDQCGDLRREARPGPRRIEAGL